MLYLFAGFSICLRLVEGTNLAQAVLKTYDFYLIQREFHFLQEGAVARIVPNIEQQRIAFDFGEAAIALFESALQLLEGFVCLAKRKNLGNLKCCTILKLFDVIS
jgi:hypothetical protein